MAAKNKVSETVIRRLPIYHRIISEVVSKGIERISSQELSKLTGFTASQIRQDLNNFGGFGQQGYGYNTEALKQEVSEILGMNHEYRTVVIGAGRLGTAIADYEGIKNSGFKILALFDNDKNKVGKDVSGISILDIQELENFVKSNKVDVAVITVPKSVAVDVIYKLASFGIKGIWNFAPVDVSVEGPVIENIRINDSLFKLSYYLKNND
ncbi:redox-sensing transcriptional repressor [Peptoniphilus asaccharolyticus DSM 20463]|uniref:Redox-sensing transcriptional repressor Rex n=1 Tax=Peptoniphilus asaccharolyticus DSM 20463 TaxID=573058 RepID=A0A1W1VHV4_PEPAS|nr:redox-sensing transcriptional repressor Rex [Peptoniphilus asaccharolyticus]MBL7574317.1 redox-sensing transcriptional repressor Rex [Peptoniphilus asaccharolyticus]SMB92908.1 redox-sensing transcriptional repressor [Peptoniphilus asaccharolyticus DSM 20463]